VAAAGMKAAVKAIRPGRTESQIAAEAEHAMREAGAQNSGGLMSPRSQDEYRPWIANASVSLNGVIW